MRLGQFVVDVAPLRAGRDFRYAFAARLVSLLGVGVTGVALAVQVFEQTGSSFHVALVSLALGGPLLAGTLAGGVLADQVDRRRLVVRSRALAAAGFAALGLNALLPEPALWPLYACAALIGLADGLSETALMAATPALVGRERLAAAETLTSITTQLGTVAGPSLGGLLIAGPGLAACFGLTTLTTAGTIVLLCRIRPLPPAQDGQPAGGHPIRALADGARYAVRNRLISGLILLDLSGTLFAMPYAVFPELVAGRFGGDAVVLGLLYSAPATGALLTALTSGWVSGVRRPGRWLTGAVALWGLAMVGFGLSDGLWAGLLFLAISGAGQVVSEVLAGALLQGNTPDHLLGRVSSLWLAEATVGPALGNLIAGGLARVSSPAGAVIAGGLACLAGVALLTLAVPELRRARPLPGPAPR